MNKKNLFSIVTVTLNNVNGLHKTYYSLISQKYSYFEWIVIDGLSDDDTIKFLKQLPDDRLKWVSETDWGIYDAMNKGISLACGNWILFLNSGDILQSSDTLNSVYLNVHSFHLQNEIIYGNFSYLLNNGKEIFKKGRKVDYIWHSLPSSHQAIFYPSEYLKINNYDLKYRVSSDYYITALAYVKNIKFVYIELHICKFQVGGFSSKNYLKAIKEAYEIQKNTLLVPITYRIISLIKRFFAYNILKLINVSIWR